MPDVGSIEFTPAKGLVILRGVRRATKVGSIHLPPAAVQEGGQQEFVVLGVGKGCECRPDDRVITTRHPGITWQPEVGGPIYRIAKEEVDILAIIAKEG